MSEFIEKIRERNPDDISQNLETAINSLWRYCEENDLDTSHINAKLGLFENYFKDNLFGDIIHRSNTRIPDPVIFKSPESLGGVYAASGDHDIKIGNTNYVFASFNSMRTALANGKYTYQILPSFINAETTFVVPMDIHDLSQLSQDEADELYFKNIFTFTDFKRYFSLFCAIFFESVYDAIPVLLYIHNSHLFDTPDYWKNPEKASHLQYGSINLGEIYGMFVSLIKDYHLIPPVSAEIQIRDEVEAILIK
jgi:hypothetical protein